MASKLNIFEVLSLLDAGDMGIYQLLEEDSEMLSELTKNIGWMLPIWMTGSYNKHDQLDLIRYFNEDVSQVWDALGDHPELRLQLLAAMGLQKNTKHRYIKRTLGKHNNIIFKLLLNEHPDIKRTEVDLWCKNNDIDDVEELASRYGYQDKGIKEVIKVFKKMKG